MHHLFQSHLLLHTSAQLNIGFRLGHNIKNGCSECRKFYGDKPFNKLFKKFNIFSRSVQILIKLIYPWFSQRGDSYRMATEKKSKKNPKKDDLNELKQELDMDEHRISLDELYSRLSTDPQSGLTAEQAK